MAKAAGKKDLLENLTSNYSAEVLKLAASQMELTKEQATAIFTAKGLKNEQLEQAVATATLSTTQKKATTSTLGLGAAFKGLGTTLKSFALANPVLTVLAAIGLLTAAYIKWGDTVANSSKRAKESLEEYQKTVEDIKSLNDELDTTATRIDELNAKENLSLVEIDELDRLRETNDELERELSIRKALEEQQGKKANDDALKYFNKESTYGTSAGRIDISGNQLEILDYQMEKIKELEEYFKTADASNKDFLYVDNEKLLKSLKEQTAKTIEEFMELDDGLIEGMDDGIISRLDEIYDKYAESTGSFGQVQADKISGILEKVDFQKYNDILLKMGEDGKISVSELSSRFPDLINYLKDAGVSAEQLYQYIMALSNPDAINYDEARKQLMKSVGINDGVSSGYEAQLYDKLSKSGLTGNEGLEAYLQVKAKYTDGQTEFWSIDDWISNIQAEMSTLEESANETPILSVSDTIDQLNTQLRPTLESLGKAYQDIFTTEDGKDVFTLDNVDLSMLTDIKSAIEELNEIEGIDIDLSSYDKLANVLTNPATTAAEAQGAFNDFTSSVLYGTTAIDGMDDSTAQLVTSMLESMGVANAEEVVMAKLSSQVEGLALQKQFAAQTGKELIKSTSDEVLAFLNHAGASETARQYLFSLIAAEQAFGAQGLNTEEKIAKLKELATAYGQTAIAARIANLEKANKDGHVTINYDDELASLQSEINDSVNNVKIDFASVGSGSAGSAGKQAADEYVKQFEKSLGELDRLKEIGILSEKQYLDKLRVNKI